MGVVEEVACEPRSWLRRERTPALLAALVTVFLWASAFVGIR
jgi:hypothetical protein